MKPLPVFYAPPELLKDPACVSLPPDEAVHASRVLRVRTGDHVNVADGEGGWYRVRLDAVSPKQVTGAVLDRRRDCNEPPTGLSVGLPLLKSRQRFEMFLEKAVELGVTEIITLVTERTEGRQRRPERMRQILVAAMKQCRRCRLPRLRAPRTLDEVFAAACGNGLNCIAHHAADADLVEVLGGSQARGVCILVGPEGGFSQREIAHATSSGFVAVSLGPRRLRSETAAMVAAGTVTMHRLHADRQGLAR